MSGYYPSLRRYRERLAGFFEQLYPADGDADPEQDLTDAAAEIDARAAARYLVPLPAGIELVVNWNMTLAEELAWSRGARGKIPENVAERCKEVRRQLIDIASGKLVLSGVPEASDGIGGAVLVDGNQPVFGRDKMRGY